MAFADAFGGANQGEDAAIDANGSIVVAGHATEPDDSYRHVVVAQFRLDGKLDKRFGGDGIVTVDVGGTINYVSVATSRDGVAFASDGLAYLLKANGSLERKFGSNGGTQTGVGFPGGVMFDRESRIVVSGTTFRGNPTRLDFAVTRLLTTSGRARP